MFFKEYFIIKKLFPQFALLTKQFVELFELKIFVKDALNENKS